MSDVVVPIGVEKACASVVQVGRPPPPRNENPASQVAMAILVHEPLPDCLLGLCTVVCLSVVRRKLFMLHSYSVVPPTKEHSGS